MLAVDYNGYQLSTFLNYAQCVQDEPPFVRTASKECSHGALRRVRQHSRSVSPMCGDLTIPISCHLHFSSMLLRHVEEARHEVTNVSFQLSIILVQNAT